MSKTFAAPIKSLPRERPPAAADPQSVDASRNETDRPRFASSWIVIAVLIFGGLGVIVYFSGGFSDRSVPVVSPSKNPIPDRYDADRAMGYLTALCDYGPRPSGSEAMERQQQYLERFFQERGAEVRRQSFETRHPDDGSPVPMTNLIASWYPDRPKRFLFCAHYDTRPYPDRDRFNKRGVFIGANDGASGTAGLMELANQLDDLPSDIGVDMVLFDGEEFVWQEGRDRYFIGSTYFAQQYVSDPPEIGYQAGILLDMIGDKELRLYYERNSLRMAKGVATSVWKKASELGVRAFVTRLGHELRDDHLPLNQIGRIPTIDIIDFDYPRPGIGAPSYWHTEQDVPANCSGTSVAAVVWVVHQWLISQSAAEKNVSR